MRKKGNARHEEKKSEHERETCCADTAHNHMYVSESDRGKKFMNGKC